MPDVKAELHRKLQASRTALLSKLENLSEYDRRRPMTVTGTNLLGLVKHLAGLEYAYLGESLGYPAPETMSWIEDGSIWHGADMWARPDETSEYITGLYRRACAHADGVIAALDLDAPGSVAHWPEGSRDTTLGVLLIRMVAETAQHAGHADIVRELIDGTGGPDQDAIDKATWREYVDQVQAARAHRRTGLGVQSRSPASGFRQDGARLLRARRGPITAHTELRCNPHAIPGLRWHDERQPMIGGGSDGSSGEGGAAGLAAPVSSCWLAGRPDGDDGRCLPQQADSPFIDTQARLPPEAQHDGRRLGSQQYSGASAAYEVRHTGPNTVVESLLARDGHLFSPRQVGDHSGRRPVLLPNPGGG
jgi:Protein of unknown function (DUF664)